MVRRYACNHRLRNATYHWAQNAIQHDPTSRAKYDALRAKGHGHARALRSYQLGLDLPLCFETKSTTIARDPFYSFDNIGRFRAAQTPEASSAPKLFLTFNALGLAIVLANSPEVAAWVVPPDFKHGGRRRSVVLIDEIDKAPRDFPNDILNEIERLYFRIPELGDAQVSAEPDYRPVVIMTSNSEKTLPDAFPRRCIFYNISFPDDERLERIILARLPERLVRGCPLLCDAISFFGHLRQDEMGLRKLPGTAELLNWLEPAAPRSSRRRLPHASGARQNGRRPAARPRRLQAVDLQVARRCYARPSSPAFCPPSG